MRDYVDQNEDSIKMKFQSRVTFELECVLLTF